MNFFTRRVAWATWQFGLLKTSMLALGIILGARFPGFWKPWLWPLGVVFLITAAWVTILWFRAMKTGA